MCMELSGKINEGVSSVRKSKITKGRVKAVTYRPELNVKRKGECWKHFACQIMSQERAKLS